MDVNELVVFVELYRRAAFEYTARVDLCRLAAFVHTEKFGVAVLCGTDCQPGFTRVVEYKGLVAVLVLCYQCTLACRDLYLIDIVPGLVAVVDADVDRVGVRLWHILDHRPNAFGFGQVPRGRDRRACCGLVGGIYGVDVKVLIAAFVLYEQYVFSITRPEILPHRACLVVGHRTGRLKRLAHALDPDVHRAVQGFDEGNILAVGRDLGSGVFGIAEQKLAVNDRRKLCTARGRQCPEQDKETEGNEEFIHNCGFLSGLLRRPNADSSSVLINIA